jgi:hypothetical protein
LDYAAVYSAGDCPNEKCVIILYFTIAYIAFVIMFGLGSNVLNLGLLLSQLLLLLCEPLGVLGRESDHAGVRKLSMIEFPTPGTPITASLEPDESLTFMEGNDIPLSELEHVGPEFSPD